MPAFWRRLVLVAGVLLPATVGYCAAAEFRVGLFRADVTPRLGHPLLGGQFAPARSVDDPLFANGLVLLGAGKPIVIAAIDWCEIRNDAYDRWRTALAEAAGTPKDRVLLASVHQHDAPLADLAAQRLLEQHQVDGKIIDLDFHERMVERVAQAVRECIPMARRVTHVGVGQAQVEQVASNRRIVDAAGKLSFGRYSNSRDPAIRDLPAGTIDPLLRTISLWDGDEPVVAVSAYATHPMSYYGQGAISSDFVGLARARREADDPRVRQVYFSGASGDVTAGKFNDGSPEARVRLTESMHRALTDAWKNTKRTPLATIECRGVAMTLPHRESPGWTSTDLRRQLADPKQPLFQRALAAMGLSSRQHDPAGHNVDLQAIDFGPAVMVLLPAESFVAYQLMAQQLRPNNMVMTIGYGECSPGYIPTDQAFAEGFANEHGWCWVSPGAEGIIRGALEKVLAKPATD